MSSSSTTPNERGGRLLPNAVAGAMQAVTSSLVLFALYRILLLRVGADGLGAWSLLTAWLTLARLADLGLPGAMVKLSASSFAEGQSARARHILKVGILVSSGLTALAAAAISVAAHWVAPALLAREGEPVAVLFWAGLVAWLTCVSTALRAALDALQRVDLRHAVTALQSILFLVAALGLVRGHSVLSLVQANCLGAAITALVTVLVLRHQLARTEPGVDADRVGRVAVRELFRYALPYHATSIAALMLDPLVKLLLGELGSLAQVTWYEMASRLVLQVRGVVASAMEALVPHVAALGQGERRAAIDDDYQRIFAVNLALSSAGLGLLVANVPVIEAIWLGSSQPFFVTSALLLGGTWWISASGMPAYFIGIGLGIQRWNVMSHVVLTGMTVSLGLLLRPVFGGLGILIALFAGTLASTLLVIGGCQYELGAITGRRLRVRVPLGYFGVGALATLPSLLGSDIHALQSRWLVCGATSVLLLFLLWHTDGNGSALRVLVDRVLRRARNSSASASESSGESTHP